MLAPRRNVTAALFAALAVAALTGCNPTVTSTAASHATTPAPGPTTPAATSTRVATPTMTAAAAATTASGTVSPTPSATATPTSTSSAHRPPALSATVASPVRTATPVRTSAPVKASAPVKTVTPVRTAAPVPAPTHTSTVLPYIAPTATYLHTTCTPAGGYTATVVDYWQLSGGQYLDLATGKSHHGDTWTVAFKSTLNYGSGSIPHDTVPSLDETFARIGENPLTLTDQIDFQRTGPYGPHC